MGKGVTGAKDKNAAKIKVKDDTSKNGQVVVKEIKVKTITLKIVKSKEVKSAIRSQKQFATTFEFRLKKVNKNAAKDGKKKGAFPFLKWEDPNKPGNCKLCIDMSVYDNAPKAIQDKIDELRNVIPVDDQSRYGIEYVNGVPDFTPAALVTMTADYSDVRDRGLTKNEARQAVQANAKKNLASILNNDPEKAKELGIKDNPVTSTSIKKLQTEKKLTFHETSDLEHIQLVPTVVNDTFGHCGGVSEINKGAFKQPTAGNATASDDDRVVGFASKYIYPGDQ